MAIQDSKHCSECKEEKPASAFYLRNGKPRESCKACFNAYVKSRAHLPEVRERQRAACAKYVAKHPDRAKQAQAKYRAIHAKELKARRKENYWANRDEILEYVKNWEAKRPGYKAAEMRKRRAADPEAARVQWRKDHERQNSKMRELAEVGDPIGVRFMLRNRMSAAIRKRLRRRSLGKDGFASFDVLPYSPQELMAHLESQFKPGMNWTNRAEWHVDHVIPESSFDYRSVEDEEFKKCWALSNLQPLWALDNMRKQDKMPHEFVAMKALDDSVSA